MFAKKLLILGHARHGKDTLANVLIENNGISAISSSEAANNLFIFDVLKEKYGYSDKLECFNDRINHRKEWFDLICEFNKDDKSRLAKTILLDHDCYVGMRDIDEFLACVHKRLFDIIIWVDASERLPIENKSFNITKDYADIIIENNTSEDQFIKKCKRLGNLIYK